MNKYRERKKQRFHLKILMIFEVIVCYMALLNIVSHARGPQNYDILTDTPLAVVSDFSSFDGGSTEQGMLLENQTPGTAVGYQAELSLNELESIYISFSVDCPAEYAGGTLIVDLYDYESNYDSPEQEYHLTLQQGVNKAAFSLKPGENAPSNAMLRFFTTDPAKYQLKDINVFHEILESKLTRTMIAVFMISLVICVITLIIYFHYFKAKTWKRKNDIREEY